MGVGLIFGFQPPLIALALSRLGYSSFAIGSVTAASLIAVILCGPFYPRAIIRLGLKRCVVSGIVFAAGILLLMPLWPSIPLWLVLRFDGAAWSALTAVAAMASNYTMLLFSRLGFAVGEAVVAPAATSWIGDLFPAAERSRPLAIFMLGVTVTRISREHQQFPFGSMAWKTGQHSSEQNEE